MCDTAQFSRLNARVPLLDGSGILGQMKIQKLVKEEVERNCDMFEGFKSDAETAGRQRKRRRPKIAGDLADSAVADQTPVLPAIKQQLRWSDAGLLRLIHMYVGTSNNNARLNAHIMLNSTRHLESSQSTACAYSPLSSPAPLRPVFSTAGRAHRLLHT